MSPRHHTNHRWIHACAAVLATAVGAAACTSSPSEPAATEPVTSEPVTSEPVTVTAPEPSITSLDDAADWVDDYMTTSLDVLADGRVDPAEIDTLTPFYDVGVTIDPRLTADCLNDQLVPIGGDLFEHTAWRDAASEIEPATSGTGGAWRVAYIDNQVIPEVVDTSILRTIIVTAGGIIGESVDTLDDGTVVIAPCIDEHSSRADDLNRRFHNLEAAPPTATGLGSIGPTDSSTSAEEPSIQRRPAQPADPADPEPIRSTGSNTWDLITTADPTTFACLDYLGQGPEEILDAQKSGYESVPDAYLFTAKFTDGTTIDMRVHPEIGTFDDALAEIGRYTKPLGQLPTLLRSEIGRFAVRLGDETATASHLEGISVQSGNIAIRLADDRLEETLFHESVHTSLDHDYAYMRSAEWLAAQAADGRWLTEYGRSNPDGEDLAETALYVYAALHHPDRLTAADRATILERVPNRAEFIERLLPVDEPIFAAATAEPTCSNPVG